MKMQLELIELKKYLEGKSRLSEKDIQFIRDIFMEILLYKENGKKKPQTYIDCLYEIFKDVYPFKGLVYRGVSTEGELIMKKEISSFTSDKRVAEVFATRYDDCRSYILSQEIEEGLDFAQLLISLEEKGILFESDTENFIGEDEVFCSIEFEKLKVDEI